MHTSTDNHTPSAARAPRPVSPAFRAEVVDGLRRKQRELPARLLLDAATAPLRVELDAVAESRLERVERPLCDDLIAAGSLEPGPRGVALVAVRHRAGAGAVLESPSIRERVERVVIIDVSGATARETSDWLRARLPATRVDDATSDPTVALPLANELPRPRLLLLTGNALGAFATVGAVRVLRMTRAAMARGDRLVLGVDQRSGASLVASLEAEHDVHERLHRHALAVVRQELDATLDPLDFCFRVRWDADARRAETLLVAVSACRIEIPGEEPIVFRRGQTIRTAVSCIYDRASLGAMLAGVGLAIERWMIDASGGHAVALCGVAS